MENKQLFRLMGLLTFALSTIVYLLTVQNSVPFWDCSEFSGAAIWQQVPHPPGAPLFLMIGKIFDLLIPFGDPGWKINLVSAFSSSITIWLLYEITIMVIRNMRKTPIESFGDALAVAGSAFVGAMAFAFSDTFWFNAVESEVYAMATLFVAVIVYLIMKWYERSEEPGNERYLIMIAYLLGLSTGVHLLAVLAIISIVYLVSFKKTEVNMKSFIITGIVALAIFYAVYPVIVKWIPAILSGHSPQKNAAREYLISNSPLITIVGIAVIVLAAYFSFDSYKKGRNALTLALTCFLFVILGYTTYTQILLRSNANPPMNENEPKTFSRLSSYLGREQYGDDPAWPRRVKNEDYHIQYYTKKDNNGNYVYGEWNQPGRKDIYREDGSGFSLPDWNNVNVAGELTFLWKYQINHMYFRYFFWNFVGRTSDEQDAGVSWLYDSGETKKEVESLNQDSGYKHLFPVKFFALPLIFGLIGMFFHFNEDKKTAFAFMVMFLLMGVLAAVAQQQQEPQPRERDYFYTGSFMVWCMWIGIGVYSLIERLAKTKVSTVKAGGVVLASTLLVPVNMAVGGWDFHDRTNNFLPFDYSYNILQSTEENAIIFTNGDNDTFPLWYLQDVMGVRRDVRIVNLSLGNTLWYVDQLKNRQPWGTEKIPLTFRDESLQVDDELSEVALTYEFDKLRRLTIAVKPEIMAKYTDDPRYLANPVFDTEFKGKSYGEQNGEEMFLYRVQDKLIYDILSQVKFERPVYFSSTVGPDAFCGLEKYFRFEGMAMRVCPTPQIAPNGNEKMDFDIMSKCLTNIDNSDNYSTTPQYGFKLRNLNDGKVYYDPVHRRLMGTYRQLYFAFAQGLLLEKADTVGSVKVMNILSENISPTQFPLSFEQTYRIATFYKEVGYEKEMKEWAERGLASCNQLITKEYLKPEFVLYEASGRYLGPYRISARLHELLGDYDEAREVLKQLYDKISLYRQSYGKANPQEDRQFEMSQLECSSYSDELLIKKVEANEGIDAAIATADSLIKMYTESNSPALMSMIRYIETKKIELQSKKEVNSLISMDSKVE